MPFILSQNCVLFSSFPIYFYSPVQAISLILVWSEIEEPGIRKHAFTYLEVTAVVNSSDLHVEKLAGQELSDAYVRSHFHSKV